MNIYLVLKKDKILKFNNWDECKNATHGIKGTKFHKFNEKDKESIITWLKKTGTEMNISEEALFSLLNDLGDNSLIEMFYDVENIEEEDSSVDLMALDPKLVLESIGENETIMYVDGSYNQNTKEYSYALVVVRNNEVIYKESGKNIDTNGMRQINGELKGAMVATKYAIDNNLSKIYIAYDYAGIEKFATGEWKPSKELIKKYSIYMNNQMKKINIDFIKIPAHCQYEFNEIADSLAKVTLGIKK